MQIQSNRIQIVPLSEIKSNYGKIYDDYNIAIKQIEDTKIFYHNREKIKNKFAIFNCEENPLWVNFYEALYQGLFKDKGEEWKSYKIYSKEWPTEEELQEIQGKLVRSSKVILLFKQVLLLVDLNGQYMTHPKKPFHYYLKD